MSSASSTAAVESGTVPMVRKSPLNGSASRASLQPSNGIPRRPRGLRRKTPQPEPVSQPLTMASLAQYIVEHQISLCAIPIATLLTLHFSSPVDSSVYRWTSKFWTPSYYNPQTGMYGKGIDDAYLVLFWVTMLTMLRACLVDYIAKPWARSQGISKKGCMRFSEQLWSMVYYIISFSIGMKLLANTKYWFNWTELWTGWPLRELNGTFKWYYLVQAASWIHQIFVLHVEERRKDHYQMFAHHIITCTLVYCSYIYHMTRVGHVILCLFDFGDILLPAAKILKYLKFRTTCDAAFGLFLLSWVYTRHYLFISVILSAQRDPVEIIPVGCFDGGITTHVPYNASSPTAWSMFTNPQQNICFSKGILMGFIVLLWGLQSLTCMWFYLIMRVAVKVVTGMGAEDNRSDDEVEEEVDEVSVEVDVFHGDLKLPHDVHAESSGSALNGSAAARRRREMVNGTPLRDVFSAGMAGQSQFMAAQKLAESKIGCGGDDR
ncbi:sphingosine N-acyltransferase lag1 [Orbilia blumenaviensis]|uniref:Sphingosine N-acyltransferase lag1 n=1 Tax=Orbilia blumenaviensis TaxID=1796055 RepID=A0AAV9U5N9_9PEZI